MPRLVFLGTGAAGYIGSARQLSSIYFDGLLIDCSGGTVGRLEDLKLIRDIDAILISHLHSDHYGGLFDLFVHLGIKTAMKNKPSEEKEKPKIIVYSPPGLKEVIETAKKAGMIYGFVFDSLDIEFVEVKDGYNFVVGSKRITAVLMDHNKTEDFGYLIDNGKFRLFYTGDTREPSALERLKVDYLIHEATFPDSASEQANLTGHSTGKQAGETAAKVGAKRLFLTHVNNVVCDEKLIGKEAKEIFRDTVLPNDLQSFELD